MSTVGSPAYCRINGPNSECQHDKSNRVLIRQINSVGCWVCSLVVSQDVYVSFKNKVLKKDQNDDNNEEFQICEGRRGEESRSARVLPTGMFTSIRRCYVTLLIC